MRRLALALSLVGLAALPFWVANDYYVNIAAQILLYSVFALALNVLVGYGGLVSLGHAGLFGIAAYAGAIFINDGASHFVAILGALTVTVASAAGFAVLALRGTGLGFVMITVALGQIVWGVAYRWISITNGDNGVSIATRPSPFGLSLATAAGFYWATLLVFVAALATIAIFVGSPFGASLRGTRDQPRRMNALGYHVWMIRFLAFLFSGLWSGVAGVLFLYYNQFVSPQVVALSASAEALLMVIAGGTATSLGPVAGAALARLDRKAYRCGDAQPAKRLFEVVEHQGTHAPLCWRAPRLGSLSRGENRPPAQRQRRTEPGTNPSGMKMTITTKMAPRTRFQRAI